MRQLLILGFYCEVYRREPLCRVYVNDVMVDEFDIPHTPYKDLYTLDLSLDPAIRSKNQYILESNPAFFKYIEFDDSNKRFLDIKLTIKNDDNNYANGFMTRHTLVMPILCLLSPKKILEQFDHIKNRWKYNQKKWPKNCDEIISFSKFYAGSSNRVFDNLMLYADTHFPGINLELPYKGQYEGRINNYQYIPNMRNSSEHWIGSSGYFHLTLVKKLGFWRHSTDRRRGWWKFSMIPIVKYLYDKYRQHEDPRSTNT